LKEDYKARNTGRKRGDTLDYYNDSLPKRAVESLFDKGDKLSSDGDLISGYDSDDDDYDDYGSEPGGYDGYGNSLSSSRKPYDEKNSRSQGLDDVLSATGSRSAVRERGSRGADSDDSSVDDHISLYSKNVQRRQRRDAAGDEDGVPRISPATRADDRTSVRGARDGSSQRGGVRPDDRRGSYPYGEARSAERVPGRAEERIPGRSVPSYEDDRQNTRGTSPVRSEEMARRSRAGSDDSRRRPPYTAPGARGQSARLYDNNADDEGEGALPVKSIVIAAAVFVALIIFTFLIIQLNGANSRYADAQSQLERMNSLQTELTDMQISRDGYKTEVDRLTSEVQTLTDEINTLRGSNAPIEGDGTETPPPSAQGEEQPSGADTGSTNGPRTYTVKAGDSLSKIAQEFYGNNDYQKIMDANNLTSDVLSVGTVLNIP
jgi:LysM repeat protein